MVERKTEWGAIAFSEGGGQFQAGKWQQWEESLVSLKEKWDFSLGGEASAKENAFGNKEIYHLGNRNPAIPLDLMGARTTAQ